jgi:hypothetical protein
LIIASLTWGDFRSTSRGILLNIPAPSYPLRELASTSNPYISN